MNGRWKYLFRPVILERGADIYYCDEIDHIQRTPGGFKAVAHGTDDYDVSVILNGESVEDMECTCPYAEDGHNCKHMAALLFAVENGEFEDEPEEDGHETMEEILSSMSEEQVRDELAAIMKEDGRYRERIMERYRKTPADQNDIRRIGRMLENLAYEIGDRGGFIDWRKGSEYVMAFTGCLSDHLEPMLSRGEYMSAFEVVNKAFSVLNKVQMDGSSGEHSDIACDLEAYWDRIIHMASDEDRDKIHAWFTEMQKNSGSLICGDSIETVLENSFDDVRYLRPMLEEVKQQINDPGLADWRLKANLEKYRDLLVRMGLDQNEYESWLDEHEDRVPVKRIRLEEARSRNDTESEIRILEDLYRTEKDSYDRYRLLKDLLKAYEKKKDAVKIKSALILLVTEHKGGTMENVHKLRPMCTAEEWEMIREKILAANPGMRINIFHEEKLYDRLLRELAGSSMETVEAYRKDLQDLYPHELLEMYLLHLRGLSERHGSRPVYEEMRKYILAAAEIPQGRQPVRDLVHEWLNRFTTRRVMMEIMREVLREI